MRHHGLHVASYRLIDDFGSSIDDHKTKRRKNRPQLEAVVQFVLGAKLLS